MNLLNDFSEFRNRLIKRQGADSQASSHLRRFRAHKIDLASQLDERVDHGDISGDNYSRSMFEAQQS